MCTTNNYIQLYKILNYTFRKFSSSIRVIDIRFQSFRLFCLYFNSIIRFNENTTDSCTPSTHNHIRLFLLLFNFEFRYSVKAHFVFVICYLIVFKRTSIFLLLDRNIYMASLGYFRYIEVRIFKQLMNTTNSNKQCTLSEYSTSKWVKKKLEYLQTS